jgi:hypothetical protein
MPTGLPVVQVVVVDVVAGALLANKNHATDARNLKTAVAANNHREDAPSAKRF